MLREHISHGVQREETGTRLRGGGCNLNCRFVDLSQALADQDLYYDSKVDVSTNIPDNVNGLLKRSMDLNYKFSPNSMRIKRFLGNYNLAKVKDYLLQNSQNIEENIISAIETSDIDKSMSILNYHLT